MAIKLGIIGFGGMGSWHADAVKKVDGVEAYAVYDIDPERVAAAREKGLKGYDDLASFLADDEINLVLVATPNDVHCELVCAALNAGKHTICEKPVAMNVAELDQMIATAEKNGKIFSVHQNRRWDKDFVTAKTVYDSGDLGKVYAIQSRLHGTGGIMHGWRGEKAHGGGMLYDWGVHFFDQIYNMVGYDNIVSVKCTTQSIKNEEIDDYFHATIDTKQGIGVVVEIGTFVLREQRVWSILGDQGSMFIDDFAANGEIIKINSMIEHVPVILQTSAGPTRTFAPRPKEVKETKALPECNPDWVEYYANIRDVLEGKTDDLIVKPWQVRKVLRLIECCFESAATGKLVAVE
ncbi:MAG: Gfo/Idh/MocA family oxidoreductase [Clostridiales bacterium]|nr:Gfo/Idh/MocA family oxidoreductase [Clostridiales bacterium]